MKMLNEELIYPISIEGCKKEICKLRSLISKYKQHDKERTEYYASKMKELGELQALFEEYKDTNEIFNKCEIYKKELQIVTRKLYLQRIIEMSGEDALLIGNYTQLHSECLDLKRKYDLLRITNSELIYKLYNNENQNN